MTLEQVKAARLVRDYEGRYGATQGVWTTDAFLEAAYKSLSTRRRRRVARVEGETNESHATDRGPGAAVRHGRHRLCATRWRRRRTGSATDSSGVGADRCQRLLGVDRQRGLAMADGDAAEGRLRERADQSRGPQGRRYVGHVEGWIVSRVWCRRSDALADAAAHHLGKREHPQDRHRQRSTDAPARVQQVGRGTGGEIPSGFLGC